MQVGKAYQTMQEDLNTLHVCSTACFGSACNSAFASAIPACLVHMHIDAGQRMQAGSVCPAAEGRLVGLAGEDADPAAKSLLQQVRA